ncbi:MAG: hypothetical protein D6798_19175 [Deltaproteobacteria bacterium]|nr:MAG: hypothetical protein D6798_19175 [Deltaproteobacteria bacterium]
MSSYKGQLLERGTRTSGTGGVKKQYRIDSRLWRTLGQGTKILLHLRIWGLDTNAKVTIQLMQGCLGDYSPLDEGFLVTLDDGTTQSTAKSFTGSAAVQGHLLWTVGDLLADVVVQVEVEDTTLTTVVGADVELWATVLDK